MTQWFLYRGKQQYGPYDFETLRRLYIEGQLDPADLVWREGLLDWVPPSQVPELNTRQDPSPPMVVADVNGSAGAGGFDRGPVPLGYDLALRSIDPTGATYAGFWLRFVAALLDALILLIPTALLSMACPPLNLVLAWLYHAVTESGPDQATPGKRALGLFVTDPQGRRISFGRASGRFFGKIVSCITLYIGYLMAGFTQRKQALHDLMAGCLVLRK